ncbi:hypothetical protein FSP39_024705 [Pinctada imbricata]|uniref:NACHT domain-containing protein n=1 Tax=Pinctada imbricata TaxID=66713 RepID=A0AA89BWH3_PINIB|nr:hypothetical protein FSP39_024705 [Pinctada imbricata]
MASANIFTECESEEEVHNKLMTAFCCDYFGAEAWKDKFEKFKLSSFLYLTSPVERTVTTTHDIWDVLERKGLLGLQNYSLLKKLVKDIDGELIDLIEDAEDRISLLKGQDIPKRTRDKVVTIEDEDISVKTLMDVLFKINHYEAQRVPVSPFQKINKLAMEKIFAPLSIREDLEYHCAGRDIEMHEKRTKPVTSADDMFYVDGELVRNVYILGDAAIGKTVFCQWLVKNWCSAKSSNEGFTTWTKTLQQFDFLFYIKLRHVDKSRTSIIDMVCHDVFQSHPELHDVIRKVTSCGRYRCLVVTDGLDEWKISFEAKQSLKVDGIPNIENMANCTFLWSMRPWLMEKFSDFIRGNDRVVEIQGLHLDSINIVIENILVNFYGLDTKSLKYKAKIEAIKQKSHDSRLKSIMQIPLMAIACVQIWYEDKDAGNSMTSLYVALLDLLIRRSNQKLSFSTEITIRILQENLKIINLPEILAESKSIREMISVILKLGKIAHEDLVSDETHLVFRLEDLENRLDDYELNFALNSGLLSKCEAPSTCNEENVSVNFFHKSIQEFLAAMYIENHGIISELFNHLSSIKAIMELGNVLIFLTGLNPKLASSISKHIVNVADSDIDIFQYRLLNEIQYLNKKVDLFYKLQASCYWEVINSKTSKDNTSAVPYHVSDVYLPYKRDNEILRTTAHILTHHHAGIKSLRLWNVPTDGDNSITTTALTQFLEETVSLEALSLGHNIDRTLNRISERFSSLTSLVLSSITLSPDAIIRLQTALQSNNVIQTLGLIHIQCEPASLCDLMKIIPALPRLLRLSIGISNNADKTALRNMLVRMSHLHHIDYYCTNPHDTEYDCGVAQTLCTLSGLRRICLTGVHLGDMGLQLSHNMVCLEKVILTSTTMAKESWTNFIQSITNVKHTVDVDLYNVDIREECIRFIRSSQHFRIVQDKDGHRLLFIRLWPLQTSE